MKIYWLGAVLIVLIMGWHLVLCEPYKSGILCFPANDGCSVRLTRTINPFTDVLTIRASNPAQFGVTEASIAAGFQVGFRASAAELSENELRHYARKYFDLYAMLLPYSVTVEMEGTIDAAAVGTGDNQTAISKWPEVKAAELRLFGKRTAEVDSLEVMSETLQGTFVVSTRCMAHFCPDHSAMWIVDLSTGKAAGEITSDGVVDKSGKAGKAEMVVCLGDYESLNALPSQLQEDIKGNLTDNSHMRVSYVLQVQ